MSFAFLKAARSAALLTLVFLTPAAATPKLRVCSDPNNLPFSNEARQGFENRIAELLAHDRGATVEYTWWAQRRGFIRNTINAGACDVVMGVPTGMDMLLRSAPYYRSSYVFVSRRDRHLAVRSFDDPALRTLRVGVQLIGDDGATTPPGHALARRGIVDNVRGFPVYGDYRTDSPPADIIRAVAAGDVDVAVAWGPMAGYWAKRSTVPLTLTPVTPQIELPFMPFVFDIAIGVRRGDSTLRASIDSSLVRHRADIAAILDAYGVPRVVATQRGVS
jgi:mxaJ protein